MQIGVPDSLKERMDEFVLFAFLHYTANKSNSSVRFLGESTAQQIAYRFFSNLKRDIAFGAVIYYLFTNSFLLNLG